jgi:hypothetical protein
MFTFFDIPDISGAHFFLQGFALPGFLVRRVWISLQKLLCWYRFGTFNVFSLKFQGFLVLAGVPATQDGPELTQDTILKDFQCKMNVFRARNLWWRRGGFIKVPGLGLHLYVDIHNYYEEQKIHKENPHKDIFQMFTKYPKIQQITPRWLYVKAL